MAERFRLVNYYNLPRYLSGLKIGNRLRLNWILDNFVNLRISVKTRPKSKVVITFSLLVRPFFGHPYFDHADISWFHPTLIPKVPLWKLQPMWGTLSGSSQRARRPRIISCNWFAISAGPVSVWLQGRVEHWLVWDGKLHLYIYIR